uniref:Uncharacterized protein n=1 Tax=Setaria italica TaxID=4555 RepID=K3YF91_SETIT
MTSRQYDQKMVSQIDSLYFLHDSLLIRHLCNAIATTQYN